MDKKARITIFIGIFTMGISMMCMGKEESYRDPFEPVIKRKKVNVEKPHNNIRKRNRYSREELHISIDGIIWSDGMRQVIVGGEVYREGDVLLSNRDVKIIKIHKHSVDMYYHDNLYQIYIPSAINSGEVKVEGR